MNYYVQTLLDSTFEDISGRSRIGKIYAFYDEENNNIFAFTLKGEEPKVSFVFAKASSDYEPGEEDSYLNSIADQIIEDKMLLADSHFKQSDTYNDNIPWGPLH
ncbi:MAG: hypothetical protein IJM36_02805 [Acholeplasmatales bacterium]|nr:hypothetical protein [Acholeplasmatales bacterium]